MSPKVSQQQAELARQKELRMLDLGGHATDTIGFFVTMQLLLFKQLIEKRNGPLFNSLLGYLFLPVSALSAVANAAFSIRRVFVKNLQGFAMARAVMDTLAAAALLTAAIGLIAATAIFMFVGPLIYAGVVAAKALFSAGSAIYHGVKASQTTDEELKTQYNEKVKYAVVDALLGAVIAASMITILLVAAPAVQIAMTVVGVSASVFAYAFSRLKMKYPTTNYDDEDDEVNEPLTNNAALTQALGVTPSSYVSFNYINDETPASPVTAAPVVDQQREPETVYSQPLRV